MPGGFDESNLMDTNLIALAAVAVLTHRSAGLAVRAKTQESTTAGLRKKFGPEYDRAVLMHGSGRKAEAKLEDREKRVEKLNIRDLDPMEHERFLETMGVGTVSFCRFPKGGSHGSR